MLLSESFMVLYLTSKSMIHFELIFKRGVRCRSRFLFLLCFFSFWPIYVWVSNSSSTLSWKDYPSPPWFAFRPLPKFTGHSYVKLFLCCLLCLILLCVCPSEYTTLLRLLKQHKSWNWVDWFLSPYSSFSKLFWQFYFFCLSIYILA